MQSWERSLQFHTFCDIPDRPYSLLSHLKNPHLILSSPRTDKGGALMSFLNLYAHRTLYLSCESVYHSALHAHELQRIHEQNKGYIPSVKSKTTKYYRYHRISPSFILYELNPCICIVIYFEF